MTEPRRPRDVLNLAFREVKPNRADFEDFRAQLVDNTLSLHKQKTDASGDEAARLSEEIEALDREIDALVYKLYDLSDEEIAVVEASVA